MTYFIYNPLAANKHGEEMKDKALVDLKNDFKEINVINAVETNIEEFIKNINETDIIIISGGDGTLNIFANYVKKYNLKNDFYLYQGGSGNDFLNDVGSDEKITKLNKYLENLPVVEINKEKRYFLNNASFGIDGEVCVVADKLREKGKKKINYTMIAIKLLLFNFKRPNAKVIIDGKEFDYKKVWLASAINGRYIGGGMMFTPEQDRLSDKFSCVVLHKSSRLRTLMAFPKLTAGKYKKYPKLIDIIECNKIEVVFDKPTGLQVDGEVYKNVTSYVAYKQK